jgi:2-hydroxychromene-2-carboxylate isomerase
MALQLQIACQHGQRPPQRQAYRFVEMQRWRDIRGIPLVLKPKHAIITHRTALPLKLQT